MFRRPLITHTYNLNMETILAPETELKYLLINQYDNLIDSPEEVNEILEKTIRCINIYKYLADVEADIANVKKYSASYSFKPKDLALEVGGLIDGINTIFNSSMYFKAATWYSKQITDENTGRTYKAGQELLQDILIQAKSISSSLNIGDVPKYTAS